MRVLVALLLLATALSGCGDSEPAADAQPLDDLEATATTGLVRGVVVDETVTPVAGATVSLLEGNETTTDAEGRFGFDALHPGVHRLAVTARGHESVEVLATVAAGVAEPEVLRVTLPRLAYTVPYVLPMQVAGLVDCEVLAVILLEQCDQGTGVTSGDDSRFFLPVDPRVPHAVQVEMQWDANQLGGERLTMTFGACTEGEYCAPNQFGVNTLCQTWGASVLWCRVDQDSVERSGGGTGGDPVGQTRLGIGTGPGIALAVGADCAACTPPDTPQCGDACGVGAVVQQEFEAFVHVFYNFEPAPGWLFTESGAPAVPER